MHILFLVKHCIGLGSISGKSKQAGFLWGVFSCIFFLMLQLSSKNIANLLVMLQRHCVLHVALNLLDKMLILDLCSGYEANIWSVTWLCCSIFGRGLFPVCNQ